MNTTTSTMRPDLDSTFDALGSRGRRRILVGLLETSPLTERAIFTTLDPDRSRESSAIQLHHVDLPKLDDLDLIEWDRETETVARGAAFEDVRPLLELLVDNEEALPADWL